MTRSFGLDAPSALEALKNSAERFRDEDLDDDLARTAPAKPGISVIMYPKHLVGVLRLQA